VREPHTETVVALMRQDPLMVVWWGTRVELQSALQRRRREGNLPVAGENSPQRAVSLLSSGWTEVQPVEPVRQAAERLLRVHPLRALDAFQLAAALVWCDAPTMGARGADLVCLDDRLREAATREGFSVLP
jgi:hypothetical protein